MSWLIDAAYVPTIGPHFCWHYVVSGKYGPAAHEKLGAVPPRAGDAPCLWLHAVSVGEVRASGDLARMFLEDNPGWELRVSTTTATGRKVATDMFGAERVFYYPLDFSWMVRNAFDAVRPSLVVLMELEIWPNFLETAAKRKVPVAVANARITDRSLKRLGLVKPIARRMAEAVTAWFAQTDEYAARLLSLGVPADRVSTLGSVKYDAVPGEIDPGIGKAYRRLFGCGEASSADGGSALVVAGSTHPTEEKSLLEARRRIAGTGARPPKMLLVPRHPERLNEVETLAKEYGTTIRRSALGGPGDERDGNAADIIIGDTMGELAKFYAAADVAFVGGTLWRHGGQNFIEPCGLGVPTVVGPHLWNFREPAELLSACGGLRLIGDSEQLAGALGDMLANPAAAREMGARARRALLGQRGAARRMADRLAAMARRL